MSVAENFIGCRLSDDHWEQAAHLSFDLRRKGITVSAVDAIIATVAIAQSTALLHYDSDFNFIAEHTELQVLSTSYSA